MPEMSPTLRCKFLVIINIPSALFANFIDVCFCNPSMFVRAVNWLVYEHLQYLLSGGLD